MCNCPAGKAGKSVFARRRSRGSSSGRRTLLLLLLSWIRRLISGRIQILYRGAALSIAKMERDGNKAVQSVVRGEAYLMRSWGQIAPGAASAENNVAERRLYFLSSKRGGQPCRHHYRFIESDMGSIMQQTLLVEMTLRRQFNFGIPPPKLARGKDCLLGFIHEVKKFDQDTKKEF